MNLAPGSYVMGRSSSADLVVHDSSASRRHALLLVNGLETTVKDLSSKNGTLVNGDSLSGTTQLHVGDVLTIGHQHYTLRAASVSGSVVIEGRGEVREEHEWSPLSDQTERTLDLLDVLLSERTPGAEQAPSFEHLVVSAVDEVLDNVGTTRPSLTRTQARRINRLIGALTVQSHSPSVHAWQAKARRRLDVLVQQGCYSST